MPKMPSRVLLGYCRTGDWFCRTSQFPVVRVNGLEVSRKGLDGFAGPAKDRVLWHSRDSHGARRAGRMGDRTPKVPRDS